MRRLFILSALLLATACPSDDAVSPTGDAATDVAPATDLGRDARDGGSDGQVDGHDGPHPAGANIPEGCNPLAHEFGCALPWPSDVFLAGDVVSVQEVALPHDEFGNPVDAFRFGDADGFSVHPSIVFDLGVALSNDSMLGIDRASESVEPSSPTLLVDTTTGELVPHFSEVYLGGAEELQIGAIRPLVRLEGGRRYIAAVRGVKGVDGSAASAPEVFAALRDGSVVDGRLEPLRDRYESDVFEVLTNVGVERGELQLAWDFTTRTEENLTADMFSVRGETLDWLAANEPTVTITEVHEGDDLRASLRGTTFRHIEGTFTVPKFVVSEEPGTALLGTRGSRSPEGTMTVEFSVTIPESLAADADLRPGRFVQFGHGFFGRREEVLSSVQSKFGDDFGFVMGAVDWVGMNRSDRDWVVNQLTAGPSRVFDFVPRVHQAMANQLVFTHVVRNQLPSEVALQIGSAPVYEPDTVYWYGISQGHILGGTFMALTPTIDRGVLNVGGASVGFILTRSYAFLIFERLLGASLPPRELLTFEAMATTPLEIIDPIAFAPYVRSRPLDGRPPPQILLQGGVGDAAVPNLSMELHARALGLPLVTPSPKEVPMIDTQAAPTGSGLTYVGFGIEDPAVDWDAVNQDTITHEGVRRFGGARNQIDAFFRRGGSIEHFCDGPCVVE